MSADFARALAPLNNLSAMLSNTDDFVANGRSGWTLRSRPDDRGRLTTIEADADDARITPDAQLARVLE